MISPVFSPADCPKPHGGENIVLSNAALLMNQFPEGLDVTLECANGYVKESGSGVTTCADTKWTEPDLVCKSESWILFTVTPLTLLSNIVILSSHIGPASTLSCLFLCHREGLWDS